MGKDYKHLKDNDRLRIYELILEGESLQKIAQKIKFHKASIYRELNRNSLKFVYGPDFASQHYSMRRRSKPSQNREM